QSKENEIALMKIQLSETNTTGNKNYQIQKKQLDEKLDKSQKEYEKAVAERDDAKKEYENNKILYASGGVSKDTLDEKKLAYENAERAVATYNTEDGKVVAEPSELAELEKTREVDNEESLQKSIDNAVFELQRKKEDLEDCVIKSTIDGTVTRVNCKVGRFADETDDDKPMFVIENIENLQMKVDISEYDISKIQLGQKAEISADILKGKVAQGQVARISPTGEEKSGTTERVIPIVIDVDRSSSEDLIAGINAKAVVEIAKNENALFVPAECIYDNGDQTYSVYRVNENNQIEILPVELGIEDDLNIEIISESLKEGDRVINSPDMSMTEGMSVIVQGE
ncbi:MAG: efflux RND transporter periplasmic adaptor subunit, partial [Clostridiales bacterium]|nr:efflux RND transporter periplasmic adaptor subunit [Clostridiales bacterium]